MRGLEGVLERLIVGILAKQRSPHVATIEHVVNLTANSDPQGVPHAQKGNKDCMLRQENPGEEKEKKKGTRLDILP